MKSLKTFLNESSNDKKYELVKSDSIRIKSHILYRIRALKDFSYRKYKLPSTFTKTVVDEMPTSTTDLDYITIKVKAGDLGGYIEREQNLSQEGNCWIDGEETQVCGYAKVRDNAVVCDSAFVFGSSLVCDNAEVSGHAELRYECVIADNALVTGYTKLKNKKVDGNEIVCTSYN